MKRALSPFVAVFKLVRFLIKSLADAALSLILYRNIKVYLSNHLSVGIHYLSKRKTHFPHPIGIVIGRKVKMGYGCTIYQNVTIGTKETNNPEIAEYPTIEDNVTIFANSVIFGKITIGKGSIIGAGSVVFKDVPPNSLVVGNPARVLVKPAFA